MATSHLIIDFTLEGFVVAVAQSQLCYAIVLQSKPEEHYVGWRLACEARVTERLVHVRDPSLEQERSQPYLHFVDLREERVLMFPKVLVYSECLRPLDSQVYIRQFLASSSSRQLRGSELGRQVCKEIIALFKT